MKRSIFAALVLLFAFSVNILFAQTKQADKTATSKETTVTGEVVDVACYLKDGAKGDSH